jgi:hypothetical protein
MCPQKPPRSSRVRQERQYKNRLFVDLGVVLDYRHGGFEGEYLGGQRTSPAQKMGT